MGIDMTSLSKGDSRLDILEHVIRSDDVKTYDIISDDIIDTPKGTLLTIRPCHFSDEDGDPIDRMGMIVEAEVDGNLYYHVFDLDQVRKVVRYIEDNPRGVLFSE